MKRTIDRFRRFIDRYREYREDPSGAMTRLMCARTAWAVTKRDPLSWLRARDGEG